MKRALAGLLLSLAACSGGDGSDRGKTLNVDVVGSFDANASRTMLEGPRAVLGDATQVGLVDLDGAGQVVPGLATSWRVSDDGLSTIFRLRPAKWEDGRAVLARDVVTTFRRIAAPESHHPLKPLLDRIVDAPAIAAGRKPQSSLGVSDPLSNIVEIRIAAPQPALFQLVANQSVAVLRAGTFPPALGPFKVEEADARRIRLVRNPAYYDAGSVALGGVDLTPTEDAILAITRFRRGEADVVIGGGLAGLGEARTVSDRRALRLDPSYGIYGYVANTRSGPLADVRVRRALSMAVDRQTLVQRLFAIPAMQPVTGMVSPNLTSYPDAAKPEWAEWLYVQRLSEARRLLAEAGYGPSHPLTVQVSITEGREHGAVLDAVARDWAALGVQVKPVIRSPALLARDVARGAFTLAVSERRAPADSARFFLLPFTCRLNALYCNRQADRLLDASRSIANLAERNATVQRADRLIVDDVPLIPLFVPVRWALVSPAVTGWTENILGAHPLGRLDKLAATKGQ